MRKYSKANQLIVKSKYIVPTTSYLLFQPLNPRQSQITNSFTSGGPKGGAREACPPPLFLDQTEVRRAEKMFLGPPPPPFLKVWVRHCVQSIFLYPSLCFYMTATFEAKRVFLGGIYFSFFTVVVHGGLYVIHSLDSPAYQDPGENLCWRITDGKLELARRCQVTIKNSKKAISQLKNPSL